MADENENVDKEEFDSLDYASDEIKKDHFIRVTVEVRGLKTNSEVSFKGMLPKRTKKPSNAKVDVVFESESFTVTVIGEGGDLKWKKFKLKINKLRHEIIAEKSYYEVDKDLIFLYLYKKEDRSWYPGMMKGIELAEDIDED